MEARVGRELSGQVSEEALEAYFEAIQKLGAALEAGDAQEVMIAQESVVEAATKFVTDMPKRTFIFSLFFLLLFFYVV